MVRSGEESGKLDQTFLYLADYIDRSYELTAKARNALVYPGFIMFTFFAVMILMLTIVIPKIGSIIADSASSFHLSLKWCWALAISSRRMASSSSFHDNRADSSYIDSRRLRPAAWQ